MLNNISKEIFFYSAIPVFIISIVIIILLIIGKKKNNNYYKYNYCIKVLLSILIGFILSLMIGYTAWVYERLINYGTVSQNILYMILLFVLVLSLLLSLIMILVNLYKSFKVKEKELQNE